MDGRRARSRLTTLVLLAGGVLLSVAAAEIFLRLFVGRYEYASDSQHERHVARIWSRVPGSVYTRAHPDTQRRHRVIHNDLGLRQHRSIAPSAAEGEVRVGFFGDSSTENLRLPVHESFTEVLDYLLNLHGRAVTVLNFGVDGYGTDQSFLYWEESQASRDLDFALYVFDKNDVRNLYENGLFELDSAGLLVRRPPAATPPWIRAISRFHLTYLLIDARNRLASRAGAPREQEEVPLTARWAHRERAERYRDAIGLALQRELEQGMDSQALLEHVAIFRAILDRWREGAQRRGTRFVVVLLPSSPQGIAERLLEGYEVIDLRESFRARGLAPAEWRFVHDGHWNERGNELAARELHRTLTEALGWPPLAAGRVDAELCDYYASFEGSWRPAGCAAFEAPPAEKVDAIRSRYTDLEARLVR